MKTPGRYLGHYWYLHPRALWYLYPSRRLLRHAHKCVLCGCTQHPIADNSLYIWWKYAKYNLILPPWNVPQGGCEICNLWNIARIPDKASLGCLWSRALGIMWVSCHDIQPVKAVWLKPQQVQGDDDCAFGRGHTHLQHTYNWLWPKIS